MKTIAIAGLMGTMLLAACSPKFYTPNTQNVPMIQSRGQTNLALAGNGNQVEFQGAYGVSDAIAIQASGGLFIPRDLDNGDGGSGRFIEGGVGYYRPIQDHFVFETYALAGYGNVENHLPSTRNANPGTSGDISANLFRLALQPSFGYTSRYFSVAASTRLGWLNYSNITGDLVFNGERQVDYLAANKSGVLLEPALTIRGGLEKIKLQIQAGYSFNLSNSDFRQDNSFLTVGLNFNFR